MDHKARIGLVSPETVDIDIKRQCELVEVNRSSVYRKQSKSTDIRHGENDQNLELMREIDKLHYRYPTWGYRKITDYLRNAGHQINRKRVRRLMRIMDIIAIYPKLNLSKRLHAEYVQPYLLRNLDINHVDQVWGIDITYLPMNKGFMYLFIIIDWYSRHIVDYEISYSLEKSFVMRCLQRALTRRTPEIINSDQGSHFTNQEYLDLLKGCNIRVSMDGKGQALDNVRTERFFRSLKYDDIYINDYRTPREMIQAVRNYMKTYNTIRPHASLKGLTPSSIYYEKFEEQTA